MSLKSIKNDVITDLNSNSFIEFINTFYLLQSWGVGNWLHIAKGFYRIYLPWQCKNLNKLKQKLPDYISL